MHDCPDDLRDADWLTRMIARCSATELLLAVGALLFALAIGLMAAPLG